MNFININFNHTRNREEAETLWDRKKVDYDNIWRISSDRGLDGKDVEDFSKLSVKYMELFSSYEYGGKGFAFVFEPYRVENQCGIWMMN